MLKPETVRHTKESNHSGVLQLCREFGGIVFLKFLLWPILMFAHIKLKLMPNLSGITEHAYDATGLLANGSWLYFLFIVTLAGVRP